MAEIVVGFNAIYFCEEKAVQHHANIKQCAHLVGLLVGKLEWLRFGGHYVTAGYSS